VIRTNYLFGTGSFLVIKISVRVRINKRVAMKKIIKRNMRALASSAFVVKW